MICRLERHVLQTACLKTCPHPLLEDLVFYIASMAAILYPSSMSFEALTREVSAWPDEQVRRFQAFLVTLRHQREQGTLEKLAAKLDDPDPARWVSLDEAEKRLGLASE
jgi:hypothetical protein